MRRCGLTVQNLILQPLSSAIAVLNDILRPFLTRWHADFEAACSLDKAEQDLFRKQLEALRQDMLEYAELLARIAE